jgi:dolichol-phosphate mannosyltransferase
MTGMVRVLLPAYNEERSLPALLPKIAALMRERGLEFRVTVLDDGSSASG